MVHTGVSIEQLCAKDSNLKKEDLDILEEWLKKQPHLPQIADYQKATFLQSCYYRVEPAKITIDNYFTMKTHHPELWDHLAEDTLRKIMSVTHVSMLPKKTPSNYFVLVMRLNDFRTEKFNFTPMLTLVSMLGTLYWHQNGFENGVIAIFDSKGFTLSHLMRINVVALKIAMDHLQEGAPVRIKGIHFINVVPALEKIKVMIKPLIKSELYDMIQFHSSLETLYKQVPLECLPQDYGGDSPSCKNLQDKNLENILSNQNFFEWHDGQKVDESKRIGEIRSSGFGTEGTFKKLEID